MHKLFLKYIHSTNYQIFAFPVISGHSLMDANICFLCGKRLSRKQRLDSHLRSKHNVEGMLLLITFFFKHWIILV